MFADDTKLYNSAHLNHLIQEDLNHLLQWANKWLLPFNIEKCKVLHYGKVNPKNDYMMNDISVLSDFVMFINDMPDAITSLSTMFADDAKVFRQIENRADIATLQKDLDHLTDWSLKWQMNFNIKKCKRLHIGQTNPHNSYTIAGIDLCENLY